MKTMRRALMFACVAAGLLGAARLRAEAAVPDRVNFQGRLLDADKLPRNGTFSMVFRICDSPSADCTDGQPAQMWAETQNVSVSNGVFAAQLGAVASLTAPVFSSAARYLEIVVAGETLSPRERLVTGPYAFRSGEAEALASDPSDCVLPNVALGVNAAGVAQCSQPSDVTGNAATASALAADPSDCALPNVALGVNAAGVAQCSQPSDVTGSAATAGALAANGSDAGSGFLCRGVDASGNCETAAVDASAVSGSTNPVQSGAMFNGLAGKLDLAPAAAQTVIYGADAVQTILKMAGAPSQSPLVIQNSVAAPLFSVDTAGGVTSAAAGTALTLSGAGTAIAFTGAGVGQVQTAAGQDLALMPGAGGQVGIGTASPGVTLDVVGTDAVQLPAGNTAARPGAPAAGMIRYNSTIKGLEGYHGNTPGWGGMITHVNVVTYCSAGCTYASGVNYTPPVNLQYATVECVGGGGGGGGSTGIAGAAAGGGGGGGYARTTFDYAGLSGNPLMTAGGGGAGGTNLGGNGGGGNNSTVGALLTCNGGGGGTGSTAATTKRLGGAGGTATGGTINVAGQAGQSSFAFTTAAGAASGMGGSSHLGGGALGRAGATGAGNAGGAYGGGGSGAMGATANVGGAGARGVIIVTEFLAGAR